MTLAERLAHALAEGGRRAPELIAGDFVDRDGIEPGDMAAPVPAAVLVPVTDRADPGVLLTQRTAHLRAHAGQVAFPGGRIDPGDDGPIAAALREAEEEIGLPRTLPHVIGAADLYRTRTGYIITPVLAVVPPDLPLVAHEHEVAAIFEVPLRHLLDPATHIERVAEFEGRSRQYYEIAWDGRRIWGVTAAIIVNLSRRLAFVA